MAVVEPLTYFSDKIISARIFVEDSEGFDELLSGRTYALFQPVKDQVIWRKQLMNTA